MSQAAVAWGRPHPGGSATCPVLLLRGKENIGYLLQKKGPEPWINVYTGSAREQRILGYLKTWSTQVNRPGLSLWHKGLAWLRSALCQLIMPVGPDCRKEPLLKLAPSCTRITIQHPKNLICSYGCWARQFQHPLGFLISPESACFVSERGCFFDRLICHGKGIESMSLWQHRRGHRPNKDQLSKHWPGQKPLGQTFTFREDKRKFKRKPWLDFWWLERIYHIV